MTYKNKVSLLKRRIRELGSAVVAFSGGVDSAVLTCLAKRTLKEKMCAVTSVSSSIPARDRASAVRFCRAHKIKHTLVKTDEFDNPNYIKNPSDRCYYCKSALFKRLMNVAKEKGFDYVIEGTNASDILGHRPGFLASKERANVATPFIDVRMTKDDVRRLAMELKLDLADKPSSACLASRIPSGTRLTKGLLKRVDAAEEKIRALGIRQVRVRHHRDTARIEVEKKDFRACLKHAKKITESLRKLGYKFVALDMAGYTTNKSSG